MRKIILTFLVLGLSLYSAGLSAAQTPAKSSVIDLSDWVKANSTLGVTSFANGELLMRAKRKGFYYVLVAADDDDYLSEGSSVEVTLRNTTGSGTELGYGLVFHSNPEPLQQGYAFLIDTAKKRYRVVHHDPGTERYVIRWTSSALIKGGKQVNTLKIVDQGNTTDLYINGTKITSIENRFAFRNGLPGLYVDAFNIAFKDLTVTR